MVRRTPIMVTSSVGAHITMITSLGIDIDIVGISISIPTPLVQTCM